MERPEPVPCGRAAADVKVERKGVRMRAYVDGFMFGRMKLGVCKSLRSN